MNQGRVIKKLLKIVNVTTIFFVSNLALSHIAEATTYYRAPEVRFFSKTSGNFHQQKHWEAYDTDFINGGTVATGDLGTDGVDEVVTGPGADSTPQVRVFRPNGSLLSQFYAYHPSMRSGVNVAVADVDGDGKADIITAPQQGGGPQVRVFDSTGQPELTTGFYAYGADFRGGVNVAAGDLDCDGKAEIITGNGPGGTPQVRVFSGVGKWLGWQVQPFATESRGGVTVAVGNVDGGCEAEVITAVQSEGHAWVKVYKYNLAKMVIGEWKALPDDFTGGITVAAGDVDNDTFDEVVVGVTGRGGPHVKLFEAYGKEVAPGWFAYEEDFHGGIHVAVNSKNSIITIPNKLPPDGRTDVDRYVRVDLSEQRMYAYEHGYQVNTFLISSGLPRTPTPPGEYHIQRKIYSHLYSGPDYYLPNTLYNLQFRPHYYLHGAYWHNNFGHPMSHGCVNIAYVNAKWVYEFLEVGDLTIIEQ